MSEPVSASPEPLQTLLGLTGLVEPWAVRVAATLRLADLVAEDGRPVEELAVAADADPDALSRLLRFLVARGVFAEPSPRVFALNEAARFLQEDHPLSLRGWFDLDGASGAMDRAYEGLLQTVRTGRPAYPVVHGRSFWEDLAANERLAASFASLMESHSSQLADDVVRGYAWDQVKVVVDVGGGTGALLARILRSCPHVRGVLVDLVAESDEANRVLRGAGVSSRCQTIASNFFDPLPASGDVYLLRNIVHDWPDEQAAAILRRCGEAAGEAGRVLVVERVMTAEGDQRELTGMDLRMLTLFGSRERRLEEFHAIATEARLRPSRTLATSSDYWLLEYTTL